eukprot:379966-Rhodomonas_salina.1
MTVQPASVAPYRARYWRGLWCYPRGTDLGHSTAVVVLTWAMVVRQDTDVLLLLRTTDDASNRAYGTPLPPTNGYWPTRSLWAVQCWLRLSRYAMSGTEIGYAATRSLRDVRY